MKKVVLLFFVCILAFASFGFAPAAANTENAELVSGCKAAYLCEWRSGSAVYSKD